VKLLLLGKGEIGGKKRGTLIRSLAGQASGLFMDPWIKIWAIADEIV
jgi:hypothetical protein